MVAVTVANRLSLTSRHWDWPSRASQTLTLLMRTWTPCEGSASPPHPRLCVRGQQQNQQAVAPIARSQRQRPDYDTRASTCVTVGFSATTRRLGPDYDTCFNVCDRRPLSARQRFPGLGAIHRFTSTRLPPGIGRALLGDVFLGKQWAARTARMRALCLLAMQQQGERTDREWAPVSA